jgi:RNA polymerase sigma factor (sigma-70 family)
MSTTKNEISIELWQAFKNGDVEAFRDLHKIHAGYLLNYGLRLHNVLNVVEDCVQEVFIDLWQYRQNLTDPSDVRFYLMRSLRNRIGKHFRKNQPYISGFDDAIELPFLIEPSSEQRLIELDIDAELHQRIQSAIKSLTPRQKEIIYLRYFNDLSYEQICELMNINYQSARTQHYNALKVLRSELKNSNLTILSVIGLHFL